MKDWFKYQNGYVNIDDENLYLTNTGNWTVISSCQEKSKSSISKNNRRKWWIGSFLYGAIVLSILIFIGGLIEGHFPIGLLLLCSLGCYFLYKYMQKDLGTKYKIPLSKIGKIEFEGEATKIVFRNAIGTQDEEILMNVEGKGIEILKMLS